MLRLTAVEFVARALPESFLLIFSMVLLCKIKFRKSKYIISSILLALSQYIIRILPINYGVHTILCIFSMIVIMSVLNGADIILSIRSALIVTIILFICEAINMLMLNLVFNEKIESIINNEVLKTVCGIPGLIMYIVIFIFISFKKREKNADDK